MAGRGSSHNGRKSLDGNYGKGVEFGIDPENDFPRLASGISWVFCKSIGEKDFPFPRLAAWNTFLQKRNSGAIPVLPV
jgi:hypothetical protein